MAIFKRASSQALVLGARPACRVRRWVATTSSPRGRSPVSQRRDAKADPACVTLASRIETLRKEGIPDKIEKAAASGTR